MNDTSPPSQILKPVVEKITIMKNEIKYLLCIEVKNEIILFKVVKNEQIYSQIYNCKMSLQQIKELNNAFLGLNSCSEFSDFIKALSEKNKILLIETEKSLTINFSIDFLLKEQKIQIMLYPEKKNFDSEIKNACHDLDELKEKVKDLEKKIEININMESLNECTKENENLKRIINTLRENMENQNEEIKKLREEMNDYKTLKEQNINIKIELQILKNSFEELRNEKLFFKESTIVNQNEKSFIISAIKKKMKKNIKKVKKLYQATKEGGSPLIFHSKCDNINNTIVFIKSEGNRRFGGFASKFWESKKEPQFKEDKNAFLFSLDKQKMYDCKNVEEAIYCGADLGPSFGVGNDIGIEGDILKEKKLYTFQKDGSYNYYGDDNSLLGDGSGKEYLGLEYEVFQIIFFNN